LLGQNSPPTINLPRVPGAAFDVFKKFYLAKHSGRILTLQPSAGTADLHALFFGSKKDQEASSAESSSAPTSKSNPRKHIISVSTYQMCILVNKFIDSLEKKFMFMIMKLECVNNNLFLSFFL
jgi:cullin 3